MRYPARMLRLSVVIVLCALASVACGSPAPSARTPTPGLDSTVMSASATPDLNEIANEHFFNNFKTREAKATDVGYALYWLGSEFTVGGVVAAGPFVNDPRSENVAGVVEVLYQSMLSATSSDAELTLFEYSPADWAREMHVPRTGGKTVSIAGKQAQFFNLPDPNTKTTMLRLIVDFGGTIVIAEARTLLGEGRVDVNLLTDETKFLAVMQNLRPYPQ